METLDEHPEFFQPFPVTNEKKATLRKTGAYPSGRLQKHVVRLDWNQPGHDSHKRRIGMQAKLRSELTAEILARQKRVEVQPQRNHNETFRRADTKPEQVLAYGLTYRYEPVRTPTEPALNGEKEAGLQWREIPLEDVPVIGMDDDRDPGGSGCKPPKHTSFGGMRMNNVWAVADTPAIQLNLSQ